MVGGSCGGRAFAGGFVGCACVEFPENRVSVDIACLLNGLLRGVSCGATLKYGGRWGVLRGVLAEWVWAIAFGCRRDVVSWR